MQLQSAAGSDPLLGSLPARFEGFQWHSFEVTPPAGAQVLAVSPACVEAFRVASAPWWGIQFHAEVTGEAIEDWIDDYHSDPDAVAAGLDWPALRAALGATDRALERTRRAAVHALPRARRLAARLEPGSDRTGTR